MFSYLYTPNSSLIASITGPIHTVTNQWEDNRDVLDTKQNKVGGNKISGFDYEVNPIGQRTGVTRSSDIPVVSSSSWIWGYDTLGQVVSADSSAAPSFDRGYLYDAIGNRRGTRNGAVGVPTAGDGSITPNVGTAIYAANPLNQYTTIPQAPAAPTYDFDGNMETGSLPVSPTATSTLHWDAENRLVSTTTDSTATLYDGQSRRIAEFSTINNQLSTTLYLYDGWNCIAEYSYSALPTPNSALLRSRTWGLDISGSLQGAGGVGGLLSGSSRITSNTITFSTFFPTYDGNGNVSEYLSASGGVAARFEYDPFGNTLVNTDGGNQFAYRFSTKPLNFITGLYYYGYRYYDPVTGRWPSRDPIGERGGMNLYGFVGNNGIKWTDFLGLEVTRDATIGISKFLRNVSDWEASAFASKARYFMRR